MITSALLHTETERWREEYAISCPARSYRWVLGRLGMTIRLAHPIPRLTKVTLGEPFG
jgi:hypothetical protein